MLDEKDWDLLRGLLDRLGHGYTVRHDRIRSLDEMRAHAWNVHRQYIDALVSSTQPE